MTSNINLFVFNCLTTNISLLSLFVKLFDVKFLFSEERLFHLQKGKVVYGRASLVLGFELTRENDDLSSSRRK